MSNGQRGTSAGEVIGLLVMLCLLAGILYPFRGTPAQAVDVYYRAGWMLGHWNDTRAFPAKSELCTARFCTRTDTTEKYAGGNPGHVSETHYPYCPEHSTSFPHTGSKLDGPIRLFYFLISMALSLVLAGLVLSLLCSPFGAIYAAVQRDTGGHSYFSRCVDLSSAIGVSLAFLAAMVAWLMYAWW